VIDLRRQWRLGGTTTPTMGHIHNFYIRLDLDIAGSANNVVQRFAHSGNNPGQDGWTSIPTESRQVVTAGEFTKWRVANKAPKANGMLRSYEIIPGSDGAPDGKFSTGDLWVLRYRSGVEDGSDVGCTDALLNTAYVNGEPTDGQDVVVWVCLRHHHHPRQLGEERQTLPYEFLTMRLEPRDILDATPTALYATVPVSP
jgi:primary-amine oxidase